MDIDSAKENIQPLACGRDARRLELALIAENDRELHQELVKQRHELEQQILQYDGDDPLELWYEYVSWIEQSFPSGGKENGLDEVLLKCLMKFEHDDRYRQDRRLIKLYIKYIDCQTNPQDYYQELYNNGIGTMVADLYMCWALYYDIIGNFKKADAVYRKGIDVRAEPQDELQQAYTHFGFTMSQRILHQDEDSQKGFISSLMERRHALTRLKRKNKTVGSIRTGAVVKSLNPGIVKVDENQQESNINTKFSVFRDDSKDGAVAVTDKIETQRVPSLFRRIIDETRKKENVREPGPWSKARVHQNSHFNHTSTGTENSNLGFKILEDAQFPPLLPGENKYEQGINLPANHVSANLPQGLWDIPLTRDDEILPNTIPCYDKFALYPSPNEVYSPEELYAYKWYKKHKIDNDYVQQKDKIWSNGFDVPIRLFPQFVQKNEPQDEFKTERYIKDELVLSGNYVFTFNLNEIYPQGETVEYQFEEVFADQIRRGERIINFDVNDTVVVARDMDETICRFKPRQSLFPNRLSIVPRGVADDNKMFRSGPENRKSLFCRASTFRSPPVIVEDSEELSAETQRKLKIESHHQADENLVNFSHEDSEPHAGPPAESFKFSTEIKTHNENQENLVNSSEPNIALRVDPFVSKIQSFPEPLKREPVEEMQRNLYFENQNENRENLVIVAGKNSVQHGDPLVSKIQTLPEPSKSPLAHGSVVYSTSIKKSRYKDISKSSNSETGEYSQADSPNTQPLLNLDKGASAASLNLTPKENNFRVPDPVQCLSNIEVVENEFVPKALPFGIYEDTFSEQNPSPQQPYLQTILKKPFELANRTNNHNENDTVLEESCTTQMFNSFIKTATLSTPKGKQAFTETYSPAEFPEIIESVPNSNTSQFDPAQLNPAINQQCTLNESEMHRKLSTIIEISEHHTGSSTYYSNSSVKKLVRQSKLESTVISGIIDPPANSKTDVKQRKSLGAIPKSVTKYTRDKQIQPVVEIQQQKVSEDSLALNSMQVFEAGTPLIPKKLFQKPPDQFDDICELFTATPEYKKRAKINEKNVPCLFEDDFVLPSNSKLFTEQPQQFSCMINHKIRYVQDIHDKSQNTISPIELGQSILPIFEDDDNQPKKPSDRIDSASSNEELKPKVVMTSPSSPLLPGLKELSIKDELERKSIHIDDVYDITGAENTIFEDNDKMLERLANISRYDKPNTPNVDLNGGDDVTVIEEYFEACCDNINPFNRNLQNSFLTELEFIPYIEKLSSCEISEYDPVLKKGNTFTINNAEFNILKYLTKGAYGTIYCAKMSSSGKLYAIKQEKPCNLWEYYICLKIHTLLGTEEMLPGFMNVEHALIGNQSSLLVSQLSNYGSLLAISNEYRKIKGKVLDEFIVMVLTSQMLLIVDHLHALNIIHADIKPDNFLLMNKLTTPQCMGPPSIQLIDFGIAIDMTLFPENQVFGEIPNMKQPICTENIDGRNWTYQCDMFGLAGTIHALLFGSYMKVEQKGSKWNISSNMPRYFNKMVWTTVFDELLNIQDCDHMPNLQGLRSLLVEAIDEKEKYVQDKIRQFNVFFT